jgi:UDP-3-O-[3-hydroxymyristoyl] glucosamine N-acyltransferase
MTEPLLTLEDIEKILHPLDCDVVGDGPVGVRRAVPLSQDGGPDTVTFVTRSGSAVRARLLENRSGVALVPREFTEALPGTVLVKVDDPRLAMALLLRALHPSTSASLPPGIHPRAEIRTEIVGEDLRAAAGAVVTEAVRLGNRIRLHEHATVGTTGFGFVRSVAGELVHFPQCGTVVLGDDVEIFAHANVDRAALGETVVGPGTKIDHYAHVGHNCRVGEAVLICAQAVLAGGVTVGDRCFVGVGAHIREKVTIGTDVTVGMGAVVLGDVPNGATVVGVPARVV